MEASELKSLICWLITVVVGVGIVHGILLAGILDRVKDISDLTYRKQQKEYGAGFNHGHQKAKQEIYERQQRETANRARGREKSGGCAGT